MFNKIDVVIPTYKPGKEIIKLLKGLYKQDTEINNIIIINTKSADFDYSKLADMLDSNLDSKISTGILKKIVYKDILPEEFNHGNTRNLGVLISEAECVVFMTQDAIPENSKLITNLIKPFEDELVYVAYARQLPKKNCKYVEKYVRSFNYPDYDIVKTKDSIDELGIKTIFCSDVCAAYRRSEHVRLGGFKKTDFNEDMIFAYTAIMDGGKVYYASEAKVIHSHNYTYLQQYKRNVDIGKSQKEFREIFDNFKSENEGIKMLKNGIKHLVKSGKFYYIPDFILSSGFKYIGFKIGKMK